MFVKEGDTERINQYKKERKKNPCDRSHLHNLSISVSEGSAILEPRVGELPLDLVKGPTSEDGSDRMTAKMNKILITIHVFCYGI